MHNLKVGQNLQKLLIQILSQGIHQEDGSLIRIAVSTCLLDVLELVEDQLDGFSNLLKIVGREKLLDREVSQQLVVVPSGLQFCLKVSVQLETEHKLDFLSLLEKLQGGCDHIALELLLDVREGSLN